MDHRDILKYIDHTLLKADATWEDIEILCDEGLRYKTASVCVPPTYVEKISHTYGDKLKICTVVGFPLGYSSTRGKIAECKQALEDGAKEIDMVINITDVKNNNFHKVEEEIKIIKEIVGENILKIIIETAYLSEKEKIKMCKIVRDAGGDYIKTSTGFGPKGASIDDVILFKQYIGHDVKIKAAGGIRTLEDMKAYIAAGCHRIGTSSGVRLIKDIDIEEGQNPPKLQ